MERIPAILEMLETEDDKQRDQGLDEFTRNNSIPRDVAEFLSVLVRLVKPKTIVEVGTSVGYSSIWLGAAAKSFDGKVISFETKKDRAERANNLIKEAGLDDVVEIRNEDFLKADLPEFDFLFIDGDRQEYVNYFNKGFPHLKNGGCILANNTLGYFEQLRTYIEMVRDHPECDSVLIAIGHGLELTYKHSETEFDVFKKFTMVR